METPDSYILRITKRFRNDYQYCLVEVINIHKGVWTNNAINHGPKGDRWIKDVRAERDGCVHLTMWDKQVKFVGPKVQFYDIDHHDILIERLYNF